MSLSKYFDNQYSKVGFSILNLFNKKIEKEDLGDLLKDKADDFEMEQGKVTEKSTSYTNSLHTAGLQSSKYMKIDDNILKITSMYHP